MHHFPASFTLLHHVDKTQLIKLNAYQYYHSFPPTQLMVNLPPESLSIKNDAPFGALSVLGASASAQSNNVVAHKMAYVERLILQLRNPNLRENALRVLSKTMEFLPDLAPLLWYSWGTTAALLQEIVSIYPLLSPPKLTAAQSTRVCHALALLRCMASHPDTKMPFLKAQMPSYLCHFIETTSELAQFEILRVFSFGVIGALVKDSNRDVIDLLLSTEIIPLCLRNMEIGSEQSKTVATFIVQKILLDDVGLKHVCATAESFFAVVRVLHKMWTSRPSPLLMELIISCCLRLSSNNRRLVEQKKPTPASNSDMEESNFGLREHELTKVNQLRPLTSGLTLTVKVVSTKKLKQKDRRGCQPRQMQIVECLVGDETAMIIFTAKNDQVDLMKKGYTVILRDAKIDMVKGSMRLAVDKSGCVEVTQPADFTVNENNNMSLIEFELVHVVD